MLRRIVPFNFPFSITLMSNTLSTCRILIWSLVALLSHLAYRKIHPGAWKLALLAGLFAFLWGMLMQKPRRKKPTGKEDAFTPTSDTFQKRSPLPVLGADLLLTTALLAVTGGMRSPFVPLLVFPVIESGLLLGGTAGIKAAALLSLLNLGQLAHGSSVSGWVLYGVTAGVLFAGAVLVGLGSTPGQAEDDAELAAAGFGGKRRALRFLETTIQELEAERETALADRQQVRETYSEVARLHREQKNQIARLETTTQILGINLSTEALTDAEEKPALTAILTILMDAFEARSGAVWMRETGGHRLTPCAAEGNGFSIGRMHSIENPVEMFPSDLRGALETQLIAQAPASAQGSSLAFAAHSPSQTVVPYPAIVALVRSQSGEGIVGAVGLCDGRGASRFHDSDYERLQEAALPLAQTFRAIEERKAMRRRNQELTALYDLSRLFQTATSLEQVNRAAVHQAHTLLDGADTALYYLTPQTQQMNLQTARGTAVNLLPSLRFGEGGRTSGLNGWLGQGTPQVYLPDLAHSEDLLRESTSVQGGSFAVTPLLIQRRIVGFLTHFSPRSQAFDPPALKTMERIAEQLGTALERTETFSTLEQMAITDAETGLGSARYFRCRFSEEFSRVRTFGTEAVLLLIGLDRTETLVSHHGAPFVESLVKSVAGALSNVLPETCLPARYDPYRLAVLLPHADFETAERVYLLLKTQIAADFRTLEGKTGSVSISGGIASLALHGNSSEDTLLAAETALSEAQAHGGDRAAIAETLALLPVSSEFALPLR